VGTWLIGRFNPAKSKLLKYLFFISLFAFSFLESTGQVIQRQTTASAGTSAQITYGSARLTIQSSVGQSSVIGAAKTDGSHLRQGFIQPLGAKSVRTSAESNLDVQIYPNPFRDWFHVQFERELYAEITVSDLMGRPIFQTRIEGLQTARIEIDGVAAGTYLVFIRSGSKIYKGQIIKY